MIEVSLFAQHCHSRAILCSPGLQTDCNEMFGLCDPRGHPFVIDFACLRDRLLDEGVVRRKELNRHALDHDSFFLFAISTSTQRFVDWR